MRLRRSKTARLLANLKPIYSYFLILFNKKGLKGLFCFANDIYSIASKRFYTALITIQKLNHLILA